MVKDKKPKWQDDDIIDDILRRVIEMAPSFSAALAKQIADEARHEWAGERVRFYYIARKNEAMRSTRNEAILRDFSAGERIPLLSRRYGLTERRIAQIVQATVKRCD